MSSDYLQGLNAYASSASGINNSFADYRADVDNIKAHNKELVKQARMTTDLDALRGLGEEMGVRAFKEYGGKAMDWADEKALGGVVKRDTQGFNDFLSGKVKNFRESFSKGKSALQDAKNQLDNLQTKGKQALQKIKSKTEGGEPDEENDIGAEGDRGEGGEMNEYGLEDPDDDFFNSKPSSKPSGGGEDDGAEFDRDDDDQMNEYGLDDEEGVGSDGKQEVKTDDPPETKGDEPDGGEEGEEGDADLDAFNDLISGKTNVEAKPSLDLKSPYVDEDENWRGGDSDVEDDNNDFEDFMDKNTETPTTESGDIDFVKSSDQIGMTKEDYDSRARETSDMADEDRQDLFKEDESPDAAPQESGDLGDIGEIKTGSIGDVKPNLDLGTSGGAAEDNIGDLKSGGGDIQSGLGELGDNVGGDALEGAGGLLDATGIGAVIGIPLQIAGSILEGGAIIEAGKSIVDWFESDILGMKPNVKTNKLPNQPQTIAQKGLLLTPTMDTMDTQPSYGGGW